MNNLKKLLLVIMVVALIIFEGTIMFLAYAGLCFFMGGQSEDADFIGEWMARGERRLKNILK